MWRLILAASVAAAAAPSNSAPYSPSMTGNSYVDHLHRPDPMTATDYQDREKAYSYFEGVKDATEGTAWCATVELPTPDTAYEIAQEIRVMKKDDRSKNASTLIRDYLKRKFPCSTTKRR